MQAAIERTNVNSRAFIKIYYDALDSAENRMQVIPSLYAQDARISWNGNPFLGSDVSPFLSKLPRSRTEIQTMDAHPIPGTSINDSLPSMLLTVTGHQLHSNDDTKPVPRFPPAPDRKTKNRNINMSQTDYQALPRVFNQVFVLSPIPGDANQMQVVSDSFRFVG